MKMQLYGEDALLACAAAARQRALQRSPRTPMPCSVHLQSNSDDGGKTPPQPGVRNSSEGPAWAWCSQGCTTMFAAKPLRP